MKRIIFALTAIAFVSSLGSVPLSLAKAEEIKIFTGKIESVRPMMGKPPKWTYAKATVVADNGEKNYIYILQATIITDIDGRSINGSAPKRGKKVEVKYSTAGNGRSEAISIRYVPLDYVQQPTAPTAPGKIVPSPIVRADGAKTFIGKITGVTPVLFVLPPRWSFCSIVVVSDNGGKTRIFIPKATIITDLNGKDISGRWPGKGKRVEVKYSTLGSGGPVKSNEAVSIRYVSLDYVQQSTAPTTPM